MCRHNEPKTLLRQVLISKLVITLTLSLASPEVVINTINMLCTFNLQPTSPATMMECILLRLPGEIRIRILQYLLKSLQPLDGLSEFNYGKSKADRAQWVQPRFVRSWGDWSYVRQRNFHFSPQILRVCQQLYNEGIPVLYEQNSLTIHAFTNGRKDGIYADILDGLALDSSREYAPKLESRLVRLRDIASVYLNIKLTSSFLCKEPQTYLADEYPAYPSGIVPKILDLGAPGPDILSGKDITIHIETMDNQSKLLPTELHQAVIAMFGELQEIRCKSVKVMIGDIEISPL